MKIRAAPWVASVGGILRALAVYGSLGPDGFSVAQNYMAVLGEMAAVHGHDFAIEYDDRLRYHTAKEALTVEQATPYLRASAGDRVNAQLHKETRQREQLKAAAGKAGKGAGLSQPAHQCADQRDNHYDRRHGNQYTCRYSAKQRMFRMRPE